MAHLRQGPGPAPYGFRPAASSAHSSACERAFRAASRARPAARRSSAASSLRPACSYLSACASASAAAFLKGVGRLAEHRCQLRGACPCVPHHALSSGLWRFDSLRVHRASNDRACIPTAPLRSWRGHLAHHPHVPALRAASATASGVTAPVEPPATSEAPYPRAAGARRATPRCSSRDRSGSRGPRVWVATDVNRDTARFGPVASIMGPDTGS